MEPAKQSGIPKIIFVISLLIFASIIIYLASQINYFQKQLVIRESKLQELQKSEDILKNQLQAASLKLDALNTANVFLEKNTERLSAIREFLQGQLDMINEQLVRQQEIISSQEEIITSLKETNNKLDTIISQLGYLYMESTAGPTSKGRKSKVGVVLSPGGDKK